MGEMRQAQNFRLAIGVATIEARAIAVVKMRARIGGETRHQRNLVASPGKSIGELVDPGARFGMTPLTEKQYTQWVRRQLTMRGSGMGRMKWPPWSR